MLMLNPMTTPLARSVKTIAARVTRNGMNWYRPSFHIRFISVGLANLAPVTSRIAARHDSGIWLRTPAK